MAFNHYLEEEDDKPYFTTNSLAHYYDEMQRYANLIKIMTNTLVDYNETIDLSKEEIEKRVTAFIAENKTLLDTRLGQWDEKLQSFDTDVTETIQQWVNDGTLEIIIKNELVTELTTKVNKTLVASRSKFLRQPAGFNFPINVSVYDLDGVYTPTRTIESFKASINKQAYYVDPVNGNDANNGLSWETAFQTTKKAFDDLRDRDVIHIKPGCYGSVDMKKAILFVDRNISLQCEGKAYLFKGFTGNGKTWTVDDNIHTMTTAGTVLYVRDTYTEEVVDLKAVTSVSECKTTPYSYYKDTPGTLLHINIGREPDINTMIGTETGLLLSISEAAVPRPMTLHFKNISFIGGFRTQNTTHLLTTLFEGCEFLFAASLNGLTIEGNNFSYLKGCLAERNNADGFNYHARSGVNPHAIEVDCIGRYNGLNLINDINNGSTLHELCKAIRINGLYHDNLGRNVHDINDSMSWNIGCFAFDSLAINSANRNDFAVWNNAKMWNYKCKAYGETPINLSAIDTAVMQLEKTDYDTAEGNIVIV